MAKGKMTPAHKAAIISALGYFICPIDLMPDPIFVDDAGFLAAVVGMVASCSDPEVVAAAKAKCSEWFD